jgi:cation diffusion facilitator family transporter
MRYPAGHELPDRQKECQRKAERLEWISLVYWMSAIALLFFTLGQSQAMKAAWVEDILGLFPPIAFLVAARYRHRNPNEKFAWGYHRSITVAYTVATLALFILGAYILIDSVEKLVKGVHPPIPVVELFGENIWLGWLMIGALLYSGIPPLILGQLKRPLARELHDKVLFADAKMNRADWLTASAAIIGVVGIGFGIWWLDSVAASVIALDILHDGQRYLRESVGDLMDQRPKTYDESKPDPVVDRIEAELAATDWIRIAVVRTREQGHLIAANLLVVARDGADEERIEALIEHVLAVDWRVHDVTITPVRSIDGAPEGLIVRNRT